LAALVVFPRAGSCELAEWRGVRLFVPGIPSERVGDVKWHKRRADRRRPPSTDDKSEESCNSTSPKFLQGADKENFFTFYPRRNYDIFDKVERACLFPADISPPLLLRGFISRLFPLMESFLNLWTSRFCFSAVNRWWSLRDELFIC